jgi:hypothetical protein
MKRILILSGILLMLAAGASASRPIGGIGLYGNLVGNSTGAGGGLGLTLRSGSFPVIGLEWNLLQDSSIISGSLDCWLVNPYTDSVLSYFIGIGGYAAMTTSDGSSTFNLGGRVPFGLQLFPVDQLEIFLEVSPMIIFVPTIEWRASARLGFRILY